MKLGQRLVSITLVVLLGLAQPAVIFADSGSDPGSSTPTVTTPADPGQPTAGGDGSTTTPSGDGSGSSDPSAGSQGSTPPQGQTGPTTPPGPTSPTGPQKPTGTIPAYAFNDATQTWLPTNQSSFSYNTALGRYDSPLYSFNTQTGWYHVIPGATMPAPAPVGGTSGGSNVPAAGTSALAGATGASGAANPLAILAQLLGLGGTSNGTTGPGSTNTASSSATNAAELQLLTNALINNNDLSTATTGDAGVTGNTTAGNATTGPATVIDNLLNLLNAAWSWSNGGLSTFVDNLMGNQTGDILLNPSSTTGGGGQVGALPGVGSASNTNTGPSSTNTASSDGSNNLTVNSQTNGAINNNVNALAQSGNAGVTGNTQAGNAASGNATADVNILNMINSAINAGQSFLGVLNIFGNLNGDILFPDGFLNGVLGQSSTAGTGSGTSASNTNTGPNSTNTADTSQTNNGTLTNTANSAFNNNITSGAQSGNATVSNNTQAGNATTGAATTQNNLFNLDNTNLFGDNAVLVLVNVMGTWVGQIMNLPTTGNTAGALLTGNATVSNNGTGPNSTNSADSSQTNNLNLNNTTNGTITNNVNAGAISGNADVSGNTLAGNATSGNAEVATNVANIFGSSLNLTHWFGVLVINVFGNWTGDVNQNTAAGDAPAAASSAGSGGAAISPVAVVAAVFNGGGSTHGTGVVGNVATAAAHLNVAAPAFGGNTLVAAVKTPSVAAKTAARNTSVLLMLAAVTLMLATAFFGLERKLKQA